MCYSALGTLETFYSHRYIHMMTYYVVGRHTTADGRTRVGEKQVGHPRCHRGETLSAQ
jgi:hypothetical protein